MYPRLLFFAILLIIIWLVIKLLRSPKFDKWCDNITRGKLDVDDSSKDTMKDITKKETVLNKQAEGNIEQAEKLKNESENIKDFLGDRGVNEAEKKEDSK